MHRIEQGPDNLFDTCHMRNARVACDLRTMGRILRHAKPDFPKPIRPDVIRTWIERPLRFEHSRFSFLHHLREAVPRLKPIMYSRLDQP